MKDKIQVAIYFTIGIAGLALLAWADWRIALGVFLVLWSNNVQRTTQRRDEQLARFERVKSILEKKAA